jgi:tripartite-type tricarboxylate transporter receptor subunit TctC
MKKLLGSIALGLSLMASIAAHAQSAAFPSKPVTIVVPFSAGGVTDIVARVIAAELSRQWQQSVVVENRPGAGGNIGASAVARARPDGHTLLLAGTAIVINSVLGETTPYTLMTDLVPVSQVADLPYLIVAHPSLPVSTIPELVEYAKRHPGQLNFGSAGMGTTPHVAGELFKQKAGINMVHIPFKGAAAATTELLAGRIHIMIDSAQGLLPSIEKGSLKALATPSATRIQALAQVPTVKESSDYDVKVSSWLSIWAPGETPRAIVDKISSDLARAVQQDEVKTTLLKQTVTPIGSSSAEFTAFVQNELEKWKDVVQQSGAARH